MPIMKYHGVIKYLDKLVKCDDIYRRLSMEDQIVGLVVFTGMAKSYEKMLGSNRVTKYLMCDAENTFDQIFNILTNENSKTDIMAQLMVFKTQLVTELGIKQTSTNQHNFKENEKCTFDKSPEVDTEETGTQHIKTSKTEFANLSVVSNNVNSLNALDTRKSMKCYEANCCTTNPIYQTIDNTVSISCKDKDKGRKVQQHSNNNDTKQKHDYGSIQEISDSHASDITYNQLKQTGDTRGEKHEDKHNIKPELCSVTMEGNYESEENELEYNIEKRKRKQSFPKRKVSPIKIHIETTGVGKSYKMFLPDQIVSERSCDDHRNFNLKQEYARQTSETSANTEEVFEVDTEVSENVAVDTTEIYKVSENKQEVKSATNTVVYDIKQNKLTHHTEKNVPDQGNKSVNRKFENIRRTSKLKIGERKAKQLLKVLKVTDSRIATRNRGKAKTNIGIHYKTNVMLKHSGSLNSKSEDIDQMEEQLGAIPMNSKVIKKEIAQIIDNEEPFKLYCDECNQQFPSQAKFNAHSRLHTGERRLECVECKLYFRTRKDLSKHCMTNIHRLTAGQLGAERKFLCQDCGKSYFKKHTLKRHMLSHRGVKQHMCQFCGFKSQEVNNLKRHMALHFESQRNFVCEICGAAFHAKRTLEVHHQYKHSSDRNYKCPECSLSFKASNALQRHVKVHRTEREHECHCGVAFKRLYNLRRHLKNVHGSDNTLPPVQHVATLDCVKKLPMSRTDLSSKIEDPSKVNNLLHNTQNENQMSTLSQLNGKLRIESIRNYTATVLSKEEKTEHEINSNSLKSESVSRLLHANSFPQNLVPKYVSLSDSPSTISRDNVTSFGSQHSIDKLYVPMTTTQETERSYDRDEHSLPEQCEGSQKRETSCVDGIQLHNTPALGLPGFTHSISHLLSLPKDDTQPLSYQMENKTKDFQNNRITDPTPIQHQHMHFYSNSPNHGHHCEQGDLQIVEHDHQDLLQSHPYFNHDDQHPTRALQDEYYSRLAQAELTQRLIQDSQRMSGNDFIQRYNSTEYTTEFTAKPFHSHLGYDVTPEKTVVSLDDTISAEDSREFHSHPYDSGYPESRQEAAESLAQMSTSGTEPSHNVSL